MDIFGTITKYAGEKATSSVIGTVLDTALDAGMKSVGLGSPPKGGSSSQAFASPTAPADLLLKNLITPQQVAASKVQQEGHARLEALRNATFKFADLDAEKFREVYAYMIQQQYTQSRGLV